MRAWTGVAASDDGVKVAACAENDYIYTSTDGGRHMGEAGSHRKTGELEPDRLFIGRHESLGRGYGRACLHVRDSGVTWVRQDPAGAPQMWSDIASSADGNHLAGTVYGGHVYTGRYGYY